MFSWWNRKLKARVKELEDDNRSLHGRLDEISIRTTSQIDNTIDAFEEQTKALWEKCGKNSERLDAQSQLISNLKEADQRRLTSITDLQAADEKFHDSHYANHHKLTKDVQAFEGVLSGYRDIIAEFGAKVGVMESQQRIDAKQVAAVNQGMAKFSAEVAGFTQETATKYGTLSGRVNELQVGKVDLEAFETVVKQVGADIAKLRGKTGDEMLAETTKSELERLHRQIDHIWHCTCDELDSIKKHTILLAAHLGHDFQTNPGEPAREATKPFLELVPLKKTTKSK